MVPPLRAVSRSYRSRMQTSDGTDDLALLLRTRRPRALAVAVLVLAAATVAGLRGDAGQHADEDAAGRDRTAGRQPIDVPVLTFDVRQALGPRRGAGRLSDQRGDTSGEHSQVSELGQPVSRRARCRDTPRARC